MKRVWLKNRFVLGPLAFYIQEDEKLQLQEIAGYSGAAFADWNRRLFLLRCDGHSLDGRDITCQEVQVGDDMLRFRLEAGNGMEILSEWSFDAETGVVSRRDSLHNTGDSSRMLERYFTEFPLLAGEYEGFWQRSFWCNENRGSWQSLAHAGGVVLSTYSGRVSEGNTPFLVLRDNYAMNAIAFHLIPCGNWNIRIRQESSGGTLPTLFVSFGQADDDLAFSLAPGETWESPEVLIQALPDRSATSGSAALHRYLLKHCCVPYRPVPVLYNTWLDRYSILEPDRLRRQLAAARRIGCEAFIVDYGWFEDHNYFLRVGKWREKQGKAFDGKLAEFAEEVRRTGLQFGIWIEAEFFHENTPEIAEHPEWFARCRQSCWRLRLENPEAAAYFRDSIIEMIEKYHPTYIKNDMNHSQERDDSGSELAAYTRALHRIWSDLRRRFPEICFESCSSGGMRAGIEMLRDYDTYFISDNADSADTLRIAQGMMLRLPPGRCSHWMVAAPLDSRTAPCFGQESLRVLQPQFGTWDSAAVVNFDFAMLAAMNGGNLGFSGDLAGLSEELQSAMVPYVEFQKRHRDSIARCVGWNLTPRETAERLATWMAFQYHDMQEDRHFIYTFHQVRFGDGIRRFRLHGISPEKKYFLRKVFPIALASEEIVDGATLLHDGLRIDFPFDPQGGWRGTLFLLESVDGRNCSESLMDGVTRA